MSTTAFEDMVRRYQQELLQYRQRSTTPEEPAPAVASENTPNVFAPDGFRTLKNPIISASSAVTETPGTEDFNPSSMPGETNEPPTAPARFPEDEPVPESTGPAPSEMPPEPPTTPAELPEDEPIPESTGPAPGEMRELPTAPAELPEDEPVPESTGPAPDETTRPSASGTGEPSSTPAGSENEENPDRSSSGSLIAAVTTAREAVPIPGADVTISVRDAQGQHLLYFLQTDRSGRTPSVVLPAPPAVLSESPGNPFPYAVYSIQVNAEGYAPYVKNDIRIFGTISSTLPVTLFPLNSTTQTRPGQG